ncbi:DUF5955 family protein [Streptomyces djakartensis]|uniref:DUF5955 family protein n=1 Tax=Streptomyces djakartensis TaxID=68193 RepID=UPI003F7F46E4
MLRSVEQERQGPAAGGERDPRVTDPRVTELRTAVSRLRRRLAAHPGEFADRGIAEEELAALDAVAATGAPDVARLRRSLLLVAGAIGSVSALSSALADVRRAVDLFGRPVRRQV